MAGKFEKQKDKSKQWNLLIILCLITVGYVACACILSSRNADADSADDNLSETFAQVTAPYIFHENPELTPYLDVLGYSVSDNMSASTEFIDNLTNVHIMNIAGTVEHRYDIKENEPMYISQMHWTSNNAYGESVFKEIIHAMDEYFNFFGARWSSCFEDLSKETYMWLDLSRACRVTGYYQNEKIHLAWELDDNINGTKSYQAKSKYFSEESDILNDELCRFIVYLDLLYKESGFEYNISSNNSGTKYPVGDCQFLDETCSAYILYSENAVLTGEGTADALYLESDGDIDEVIRQILLALPNAKTEEYGNTLYMDIPDTDLRLEVRHGSSSKTELLISKAMENGPKSTESQRESSTNNYGTNSVETLPPKKDTQTDYPVSSGKRNALKKAKDYLNVLPFSYSGLIEQLEYEGYSNSEATYAADNCGADWYEQAVKSAKRYLEVMAFSRSGLIDQLEYEGFTYNQAVYGVDKAY